MSGRKAGRAWRVIAGLTIAATTSLVTAQDRSPMVTVSSVELVPISEEVPLTGSVTSRRFSRLSPQVSGQVRGLYVDNGTRVEKGQVIVELNPRIAEIELDSAQAALEESAARYEEAIRQRNEATDLLAKNHIAATVYKETEAQVEIVAAERRRLEAEVERRKSLLDFHAVTAPFDGVVGNKLVEVGEWVQAGTPVVELVELSVLRVDVPVPQAYFAQIDVGSPVRILFDALPDQTLDASITSKTPVSNVNARTFPVFIEIDNQSGSIAPGMSARVVVQLDVEDQIPVLQVDRDAIIRRPDGTQLVWRITDQGGQYTVDPVAVRTGRSFRNRIEITNGELDSGDRIVLHGNETLQAGQAVRVMERRADTR